MKRDTFKDPLDCLAAELHDAYKALVKCDQAWPEAQDLLIGEAQASLERAFQLVSDLQAEKAP